MQLVHAVETVTRARRQRRLHGVGLHPVTVPASVATPEQPTTELMPLAAVVAHGSCPPPSYPPIAGVSQRARIASTMPLPVGPVPCQQRQSRSLYSYVKLPQSRTRNVSHFVAHTNWLRSQRSPQHFSAHRVKRGGYLRASAVTRAPTSAYDKTPIAQGIACGRRSKMVTMGTRKPHSGWRPCRRCALPRRGDTPRLRQV